MDIKIYGSHTSRIGVRDITPKIKWLCHSIGEGAAEINGGFVADFARVNLILDPDAADILYNSYLFMDEKTLLVDTLSPGQRDNMIAALADLLGDRTLDYLWISHTELPHAGNVDAIRRAYPDVQIMTAGGHDHYEVHGLEDAILLNCGDVVDLGEHKIEMIKPLFVDHALTQWFYERTTGFLCPVDWTLNVNRADQSFRFMDEMEEVGYSAERFMHEVSTTNRFVFPWLRWADPNATAAAVDKLFATYDVRIFAPSHTNVIRTDMEKYTGVLSEAMRMAIMSEYELVY